MWKFFLSGLFALSLILIVSGCGDQPLTTTNEPGLAFLYQYVGNMKKGVGDNAVRLGITYDGVTVRSYGVDAVEFQISPTNKDTYGDPVFSRLSDGNWSMTAWTGPEDTRGAGYLLYYESSCPLVDDEEVIAIGPSSASGCSDGDKGRITGAKSSQVFAAEDGNYVFHMIGAKIYLAHLSDETHSAMDLDSMCVLDEPVTELADLDYGDSTLILSSDDLLLSDTAMGRRTDGTWVLFVKGIEKDNGCTPNTLCELCARSIYRTTSTDLIHWSELEKVVEEASVPEATTTLDGTVWLYWQDFSNTCEAEDQQLSTIVPISGAYETSDDYELSDAVTVSFPDEAFETDSSLHYATNANPVMLPDKKAQEDLEACFYGAGNGN